MMKRKSILTCLTLLCIILAILFWVDDSIYTELTFSKDSGFYEEPFELEIYAPPGMDIFYTLDGSDPDENAFLYTEPIRIEDATNHANVYSMRTDMALLGYPLPNYPIDKCNVVNAAYRDTNGTFSKTESKIYFVGYDSKIGYDGLNIISIVTDPDNLFDYDTGIYVLGRGYDEYPNKENLTASAGSSNFFQRGYAWERAATINIFDTDKKLLLNQECGVRVRGGLTRTFLPKSINVYAKKQYNGQGRFYADLFDTQYMADTITLFTGGNDSVSILRDALTSNLISDRAFTTMNYLPCAVFLNGEYWGFCWLTEKYDDVYLKYYYNIETDNIIMIKSYSLEEGEGKDYELYEEMIDYISKTDLTIDSNYQYACELIDIQSFIDYYATEIYIGRQDDWPELNEALWRTREIGTGKYEDGKWRWILYDVNETMTVDLTSADTLLRTLYASPMLDNLCRNENFKKQFIITFMDLVNTSFSNKTVDSVISEYVDLMEPPMNVHLKRFYGTENAPDFLDAVADVQNFLDNRKPYIVQYLKDDFDLAGVPASVEIEINDPAAGSIVLNTIEPSFDSDGKWNGEYYTDYPITLVASANDGYRFVRWEITDSIQKETLTEDTIETDISEQGISIKAVFEKKRVNNFTISNWYYIIFFRISASRSKASFKVASCFAKWKRI